MSFHDRLPKLNFPIHGTESMESLSHACKINSELGMHVKSCSFSSNLAGRFYQNNSMEIHSSKFDRLLRMREKRKTLEWELQLEEKKLIFLQQKLKEKEERTKEAINRHKEKQEQSALRIQCKVRQMLALSKLLSLRKRFKATHFIALFIQALFRGIKSRISTDELRRKIVRHRKEQLATIIIQCFFRITASKDEFKKRKHQQITKLTNAAILIQSIVRGFVCKVKIKRKIEERKSQCVVTIQKLWRKTLSSIEANRRISAMRNKQRPGSAKSKKSIDGRIPLHERRYSSYSIQAQALAFSKLKSIRQRRFSDCSSGFVKNQERRSSLSGIDILCKPETETKTLPSKKDTSQPITEKISEPQSPKFPENPTQDRIRIARLKAAARVARLERKNREEKEKQKLRTNAAKARVLELDLKRKDLLKADVSKRKKAEADKVRCEQEVFMTLESDHKTETEDTEKETEISFLTDNSMAPLMKTDVPTSEGVDIEIEHLGNEYLPNEERITRESKSDHENASHDDQISTHDSQNESQLNNSLGKVGNQSESQLESVSANSHYRKESPEQHGETTDSYIEADFDEDVGENEDDLF